MSNSNNSTSIKYSKNNIVIRIINKDNKKKTNSNVKNNKNDHIDEKM